MTFETALLGDLMGDKGYIRGPFGSALKRAELKESGIPVYEQQHAIEGIRTFRYFIDDDKYSELRRFTVEANDLIISCSGTVGRISVIQDDDPKGIISQALLILRPDTSKVLPHYLYYFLTSKAGVQELVNASHGAVQLNIAPRNIVEKIQVPLPASVEIQRQIVQQLKVIDEKIDLNRRINQTLEAMAQAIFKSWFVDFDPVKAKIAAIAQGQDPLRAAMRAISGKTDAELDQMPREHHNQLAATAALFPDAMEESELGEIPKGWQIGSVDDLCISITSGGTPSRKNAAYWENGIIPWFKTGELHDGPLMDSEEHITEAALEGSSAKLWPAGTILFALYASPTVGRLGVLTQPSTSNQAAAGLVAKQEYGVPFLRRVLLDAREKLQNIAVGAAQQNINQGILKSHQVIVPPFELATAYSKHVTGMDEQQTLLATQSRTLAQLRDTLLPKLLSGELSVENIPVEVAH